MQRGNQHARGDAHRLLDVVVLRILLLAALTTFATASTAGGIKKWVDADGKVHYGDRAPISVLATDVKVRKAPPSAKAVDISPQAQLARLTKSEEKDDRLVSVSNDAEASAEACNGESETACLRLQPVASNP